jgi:hypothetical protein
MVQIPKMAVRSLDVSLDTVHLADIQPQLVGPQTRTANNKIQAIDGLTVAMWWDDRSNNRTNFEIFRGISAVLQHRKNKGQPGFGYRIMQPGESFGEFERMSRAALQNRRNIG